MFCVERRGGGEGWVGVVFCAVEIGHRQYIGILKINRAEWEIVYVFFK